MSDLDDELDGLCGLPARPGYRPLRGQSYEGMGVTQSLWRAQERQRRGRTINMMNGGGHDNDGALALAIAKIDSGKHRILVAGGPPGDFPETLRRDERIRWWHTTEANERDAQREVPMGTDVVLICKKITHKMAGRVSKSAQACGAICSMRGLTSGQIARLLEDSLPGRAAPADTPPADAEQADEDTDMSISRPGRMYTGTLAAFIGEKLKEDTTLNDRQLFDAAVAVGIQPQLTHVADAAAKVRQANRIPVPDDAEAITDPAIRQAVTSIDDAIAALQLARGEVIKIGITAASVAKDATANAEAAQKLASLKALFGSL